MNILTLEKITKIYTQRKLFDEASFYMQDDEKVGIVGINGTGKSTLLKICAGIEEPDSGNVTRASDQVIGYLPQHPEFEKDTDIITCVCGKDADTDRIVRAKTMLSELGFSDFTEKADHMSGGQQKRLALVSVLMDSCDLLLLDEPTNHLDLEMSDWLEDILRRRKGAMIMITHDRYFLDSVCDRILEVDRGQLYSYESNYEGYLSLKAERAEMTDATDRKRATLLRNELKWVQRGARARTTKQKFRLNRYEELKDIHSQAKDGSVELDSIYSRMGKSTIEADHIVKSYDGKTVIKDFSYIFLKNDRVAIIGPNGCGKTTLIKIINGSIEPDSGEVKTGQTIKTGYYSQMVSDSGAPMDANEKVIDFIKDVAEYVRTSEGLVSASQMLEKFLFDPTMQYTVIGKLSGGEKRRLQLLRVLMGAPNVLILDEPTNDLDFTTLTILEDYLDKFMGIVVIVSHDRYFLDRTVNRIFAFQPDGTLRQYEGGYTDYAAAVHEESAGSNSDRKATRNQLPVETTDAGTSESKCSEDNDIKLSGRDLYKAQNAANKKLKMSYQEQKDYETIEDDIAKAEAEVKRLDEQIVLNACDFPKLSELSKKRDETQKSVDELTERWMYLEDLQEKIDSQE